MINQKRGSLTIIIISVIVALLLAFAGFFRYSVNRRYVTRKLNKVLLAREFSNSLAVLAAHHLRCRQIHDEKDALRANLALPLDKMPSNLEKSIVFAPELKDTLADLVSASSHLANLSYSVRWICSREDFQPCLKAYSREKKGKIKLLVEVAYSPPGSTAKISEDYLYTLETVVTTNLVPVLSKFNLYVKDALNGEKPDRFNLVLNDKSGNLAGSPVRPWVLSNGAPGKLPGRFEDLIKSPRGLVYFGGGTVVLSNTRGWGTPGDFSEGFHLYREGRGPAMYTVAWLGTTALINWEAGLCNDKSDADCQLWYELVKDGFEKELEHSSAFRLMGTDNRRSPTLVLGQVLTRTLCCRIFKSSNKALGLLPYARDNQTFEQLKTGDDTKKDISFFISQVGNVSLSYYNTNYASRIWELPYNRAAGYEIAGHDVPDPVAAGRLPAGDLLTSFVSGEALSRKQVHEVPPPFSSIYSDVSSLASMDKLLKNIEIPGKRMAAEIRPNPGESVCSALEREGYLKNNRLDLNGWLLIEGSGPHIIDRAFELVSHGGLVFPEGKVEVSGRIFSAKDLFILNLVAQNGDIIINEKSGEISNLGLIAGAQVRFPGSVSDKPAKIRGNVAMGKIAAGSLPGDIARGVDLSYDEKLAALPFDESDSASGKSLLMFYLAWQPRLVE